MSEKSWQHEITRTFRAYGGDALKSNDAFVVQRMTGQKFVPRPDTTRLSTPEIGKPDYYAGISPFVFWVEAKWGPINFGFDQIRPEQRTWLSAHAEAAWLWLFMGNRQAGSKLGRQAWMIPWVNYLAVETTFQLHGLNGIAHRQPHKVEHRELGLSAVQVFAAYELTWQGNSTWRFPDTHPIWSKPYEHVKRFNPSVFRLPVAG